MSDGIGVNINNTLDLNPLEDSRYKSALEIIEELAVNKRNCEKLQERLESVTQTLKNTRLYILPWEAKTHDELLASLNKILKQINQTLHWHCEDMEDLKKRVEKLEITEEAK